MMRDKISKITFSFRRLLLLLTIILFCLILIFVSYANYRVITNFIIDSTQNTNSNNLNQIKRMLEFNMSEIESLTEYLVNNRQLQEYIESFESRDKYDTVRLNANNEIVSIIKKAKEYNSGIKGIVVFTENGFFSTDDIRFSQLRHKDVANNEFIYDSLIKNTNQPVLLEHRKDLDTAEIVQGLHTSLNILLSNITYGSLICKNDTEYGSLFVIMKETWFKDIFKGTANSIFICDNEDIIWNGSSLSPVEIKKINESNNGSNNKSGKGNSNLNLEGERLNIYSTMDKLNGWKISYLVKLESMTKDDINEVRNYSLLIFLISAIIAVVISKITADSLYKPLKEVVAKSRAYKNRNSKADLIKIDTKKTKITFRERIMYYFIIVIFIPASLCLTLFYFTSVEVVNNEIANSIQVTFNQTAENLKNFIIQKEKIIRNIGYDNKVNKFFLEKEAHEFDIGEYITRNILLSDIFVNIDFFDRNGNRLFSNNLKEEAIDKNLHIQVENNAAVTILPDVEKDIYGSEYINILFPVKRMDGLLETTGYIKAGIDEIYIEQIYKDINSDGIEVFISNDKGIIISHVNKDKIGTELNMNEINLNKSDNTYILDNKVNQTPFKLVGIYHSNKIFTDKRELLYFNLYTLVIVFMLITIIAYFISVKFSKYMNEFNSVIENIGTVNSNVRILPAKSNITELDELGITFNEMILRIDNLINEVIESTNAKKELEAEKNELELAALQKQINPHFLCNTMETIKCLIDENEVSNAGLMIESLNTLFKYGISREEILTTIGQEIEYSKAYVSIMNIRYGNNIVFGWDIDESVLSCKAIKLTLQPILENAIIHGFENKQASMVIKVSCKAVDNDIVFVVIDNGKGINERVLSIIRENMYVNKNNVGLFNVNRRIKIYFGEAYGITIDGCPGKGTSVIMKIPKENNRLLAQNPI